MLMININRPITRAIVNLILIISVHFSILYSLIPIRALYAMKTKSHFIFEGFSVTIDGIKQFTFLLPESALALVIALLFTHFINKKL